MKRIIYSFGFIFALLVTSCNSNFYYDPEKGNRISVTLIRNNHFEIVSHNQEQSENNPNVAYLKDGNDINYLIDVDNNYYLSSVDYQNSTIVYIGENRYSLQLYNITYSMRIALVIDSLNPDSSSSSDPDESSHPIVSNQITYDANGGEYILYDGYPMNKILYSTAHHPRPNTSKGTDIMKRNGYVHLCWNTKADGSGVDIGLGSRYLDENNSSFTLYAKWVKYSDYSLFDFEKNETGYTVTKYKGSEEMVVIPEFYQNEPVNKIATSAFYRNQTSKTIVLPKSIDEIEQFAFDICSFETFYYYDNLVEIKNSCFSACDKLKTVHINAIENPRYVSADRNATYADKIDYLILNKSKKKVVIMGGSGAYYNLDACYIHQKNEEYEVCNVAVNGWFNAFVQFDVVKNYLGKDDIFIHCVESCGKYQFMGNNEMGSYDDGSKQYDSRFFNCLELNYDLIALADLGKVSEFFNVYHDYNKTRLTKEAVKYTDYTNFADIRGDYSSDPAVRVKHELPGGSISKEGAIDCNCYNYHGLELLRNYYMDFNKLGASVYFAYACVNQESLSSHDLSQENIYQFVEGVESVLSPTATFVNYLVDALYPCSYFADTDWHLDYEHALAYTEEIVTSIGI